ncbi:MAG: flagellar export chaperone FliS [Phycisphaeraceae bacterium]|nr:flagellar export chaperone FliS [Phycisphaeraceae bacterium]
MSTDINNQYLRTKVLSASPEELRLLLIEGAIRFARTGREGLIEKNYEKSFENISQSKAIVMELLNALDSKHDPDLCRKLSGLYVYMFRLLTDANIQHELDPLDEAIKLLEYDRDTWKLLMDRLAEERASGARHPAPVSTAPTVSAAAEAYTPLSIEG